MTTRTADHSTRERLLETAGQVFAAKGYRGTTVRDICEHARANVAAVNYHFGGKRPLYREVLSSIFGYAMGKYPADGGQTDAATAEDKLRAFVSAFLKRMLDPDQPAWHRRLLGREMMEPSREMRSAVERHVGQAQKLLRGILRELLGPKAKADHVDLCTASIAGQCLFYHRRHSVSKMLRNIKLTPEGVDTLAAHITEFSLYGLTGRRDG